MIEIGTSPPSLARPRRPFSKALVVLAATEFWERLSFAGMQALLVLYLVGWLLKPGHVEHVVGMDLLKKVIGLLAGPLTLRGFATQVFGIYVGLVYLAPVAGGAVGDRWIGRRAGVISGGLLMGAGHLCFAFEPLTLVALGLLLCGAGLLRGNLVAQVSDLYAETEDDLRDAGFQLYFAMVNAGGFVAPLITGALAPVFGWRVAFGAAGIGMLIGVATYVIGFGRPLIQAEVASPPLERDRAPARASLTKRRLRALVLAGAPLILFWIAQSQIWNTYNLWATDHVALHIGAFIWPVPWLQAVDALSVVVLVPPLLSSWAWLDRRGLEPDDLGKIALGAFIFALALLWLAAGAALFPAGVPLAWVLTFHLLSGIGYLHVGPIAVAFFGKYAPKGAVGATIGCYLLTVFIGSTISGRLGELYETLPSAAFWALHAGAAILCSVFVLSSRNVVAPILSSASHGGSDGGH